MATVAETSTRFARLPHPDPVADAVRAEVLANPGFGARFTDHMVTIEWSEAAGWHNPTVAPYGPIALDPAASVLHYAQEIFEGLKAYRHPDGSMALFRPDANAERFNASARRLAMPELPENAVHRSSEELVRADANWFPTVRAVRSICARS
jgi:branched-chain amino acid aminotransferase